MTFTHALSTNNYGPSKFIVSKLAANGTHTTITSALAAAVSGDTVVIRDGTYTENFSLKAGVSLQAFESSGLVGNVLIDGTVTFSQAGTASLVGIKFQNSSFASIISITGANACVLDIQDCIFISLGAVQFIFISNNNASTVVKMFDCEGDLSLSGAVIFTSLSGASFEAYNCYFTNSGGGSASNSVLTSGNCKLYNCQFKNPVTNGGTVTLDIEDSILDCSAINETSISVIGSGSSVCLRNTISSGSASAITIDTGATLNVDFCVINSTNTNAITGMGTINYGTIDFTGSSSTINTSIQTALKTQVGSLLIHTPISLSSPVPMMRDSTTGAVGVGATSVITSYLVSGSYSVNANAKEVEFYVWGGGGGGGSGRDGATSAAGGGAGGGGGGFSYAKTLASLLTASPYTVTIGSGGTGGLAVNATNTDGNPGNPGNPTSVVGVIIANGGGLGLGGVNGVVSGGTTSVFFVPLTPTVNPPLGGSGEKTTTGLQSSDLVYGWTTGGSGGSGYTTGTARTGTRGGNIVDAASSVLVSGGTAGSNAGGTAGDGNPPTTQPLMLIGGTGGGSGGNDGVNTAGSGGNGAQPGGGGGGGSGNLSLNASGAGGNGGNGKVIIIEYF